MGVDVMNGYMQAKSGTQHMFGYGIGDEVRKKIILYGILIVLCNIC